MELKKWFRPFEDLKLEQRLSILTLWIAFVLGYWFLASAGDKRLFPPPGKVWEGLHELFNEGLMVHVVSSLSLCLQATLISIVFSLIVAYLSPVPILRPVAIALSRMRYLPLTGITFYLAVLVNNAREMQIWVLVIFMSLYFITSLLGIVKDVPQEEIDHARSLKCSRWEVLWEVIIKGRMDYVLDVLRQNLAIIWMMLVTVESILVGAGGLGVLIKNSDRFMNHGRIVALQLVILLVGLGIDLFINSLRKMLFRYSKI